MFKVGDKIKCINNDNLDFIYERIDLDIIYTVLDYNKYYGLRLKEIKGSGWYSNYRFVNITRELKLKKILCQ